jgi:hypothetical protein
MFHVVQYGRADILPPCHMHAAPEARFGPFSQISILSCRHRRLGHFPWLLFVCVTYNGSRNVNIGLLRGANADAVRQIGVAICYLSPIVRET